MAESEQTQVIQPKKKMGFGIYGPSLDKKGNCIAGCELLKYISEALHLHIFDTREWKVEE